MHLQAEEMVEEAEVRAVDEGHSATVRHYFTTAPVTGTRANEKHERSEWTGCWLIHQSGRADFLQVSRTIIQP